MKGASHHPEVPTHPHHIHDGDEENVLPCEPMTAETILAMVAAQA